MLAVQRNRVDQRADMRLLQGNRQTVAHILTQGDALKNKKQGVSFAVIPQRVAGAPTRKHNRRASEFLIARFKQKHIRMR